MLPLVGSWCREVLRLWLAGEGCGRSPGWPGWTARRCAALQACLLDDDGIPAEGVHGVRIQLASADDIDQMVTPSHPLIARQRLALVATEALVDLVAQGTVVEVANGVIRGGQPERMRPSGPRR